MMYDIVNIHGCDWLVCMYKTLSDWVRYLVIVTCTGKSEYSRGSQ